MHVLVLGGYGLIGLTVVRRLLAAGHTVTGLGRSTARARQAHPDVTWIDVDIARMTDPGSWLPILSGVDAVANCAGALQDGSRDNLTALSRGVKALFTSCESGSIVRVVQVSAAGVAPDASTAFYRSKAEADAALAASSLSWIILRPGLVIARAAYGGTALIRAAASFPWVRPIPAGTKPIQTVCVDDVAHAVVEALEGAVPDRRAYDLVEPSAHSLAEIVQAFSSWLGHPPAPVWILPPWLERLAFTAGDCLGHLGWRSPLRTTALRQLRDGVRGDPEEWPQVTGKAPGSLAETLRGSPSCVQERWFGRLWLLKPVIVATLALFWTASGAIGLIQQDDAIAVLTDRGLPFGLSRVAVTGGSLLDIVLGTAIVFHRCRRVAALGMMAAGGGYLLAGSLAAPDLWLDPLGPLLKAIPAALLAAVALALAEER